MSENNEKKQTPVVMMPRKEMLGRRQIFTSKKSITMANVAAVVEDAYNTHSINRGEIDYLWNYYKGKQPSLYRTRELRNDLTKTIVENIANEIVSFKVGFMIGKSIQYISADGKKKVSASVEQLNKAMRIAGKHTKDRELIEWCMICGVGYRYITQNRDKRINSPFRVYTLDPRNTFVIRANDYTQRVLAAVNYVIEENENILFTVYTEKDVFTFRKGGGAVSSSVNAFGAIPIIEYCNNNARTGCFEIVLTMLDAINDFDSARNEAVEQFVQSLLVLYNCQVDEGTTADTIRAAGMILLKSMNGEKADVKNLSEQLDQQQNQTLKNDMYQSVLRIVGVPSQGDGNTGDSSNNGAIVLKNGWQGAETRAEAFETMFQEPEMEMLRVVAVLCSDIGKFEFSPEEVEIHFTRRNYENILSKSQTLTTMLGNDKIHPKCAYEASGLFVDTEEAYRLGMKWYQQIKGQMEAEDKEKPVNTDE